VATHKIWLTALTIILITLIASTAAYAIWQQQPTASTHSGVLYQILPFNTFSEGNFGGTTTFAELAQHGDFGIGTLDGLNGEMIALDGTFYQVPITGIPRKISPNELTPYATVTFFNTTQTLQITNSLTYQELVSTINQSLPDFNSIYAIKIHGIFSFAQTRSPAMQEKPYPNLTQALVNQAVFNLTDVSGTAVGFYFPSSMNGIDYAGYHLHFITDDLTAGGHLLDCTIQNATIDIDQIRSYTLIIP
jgi:acetolactate decarboxylase